MSVVYDYCRFRELGGSAPFCKGQGSNYWSRANRRWKQRTDRPKTPPVPRSSYRHNGNLMENPEEFTFSIFPFLQRANQEHDYASQRARLASAAAIIEDGDLYDFVSRERRERNERNAAFEHGGGGVPLHDPQDEDDDVAEPRRKWRRLTDFEDRYQPEVKPNPMEDYRMIGTEEFMREEVDGHMPFIFKENKVKLGRVNKIFAAAWLKDDRIVMGTKCNTLLSYDASKRTVVKIPTLPTNQPPMNPEHHSGIHSISVNPSGTLLAAGADHPADVAVYRLPDFTPVTVGGNCHKDWIFTLEWLDDEFLVSGSRDSSLALWQFHERPIDHIECDHVTWLKSRGGKRYPVTTPVLHQKLLKTDKIRAFACNNRFKSLTAVSLNSFLNLIDLETFNPKRVMRLDQKLTECVCAVTSPDQLTTCIGSKRYFTFFDARDADMVYSEQVPQNGGNHSHSRSELYDSFFGSIPYGVRSLSWHGHIVTVGTAKSTILFYDIRNRSFLQCDASCRGPKHLNVGVDSWHAESEVFESMFRDSRVPNAVYAHVYDQSRTRLFAAGGPIAASVEGNFASLFR